MKSMSRILIVDDEPKITRILDLQLKHEGYETLVASNGLEAVKMVEKENVDLVLLDIMMPVMDGFEALKHIKALKPSVKAIMLTAKDAKENIVEGLDYGADDYVTKPFDADELLARIRAQLRTHASHANEIIRFEGVTVNATTWEVEINDEPIVLSKTEFSLLKFLLESPGVMLSRETILQQVWGYNYFGGSNIVDVYIKYLRDKIEPVLGKRIIHTVRGAGYIVK